MTTPEQRGGLRSVADGSLGVASINKAWAYCNPCRWTGPDRASNEAADFDLRMHKDAPGHYALAAGGDDTPTERTET
jgi:hypothetical protein